MRWGKPARNQGFCETGADELGRIWTAKIPYWGIAIAYTIALLLTLSWSGALVLLRPLIKHSAALHRLRGAVERGRDRLS